MEFWYLLYCKRGQLLRAKDHLERQHVSCFTPMVTREKLVRGKRALVEEPLFPNYMFIKFNPEVIHTSTIGATRGVSHFVRFGAQPATVPPEVIQLLQQTPSPEQILRNELAQPGDTVVVTDGTFAGLQAIYAEPDGDTRSILLLKLLNKPVLRSVDNRQFEKL